MKQILYIILLALIFVSCDEDFFETAPGDKITDASFWSTKQDFDYAVNTLYHSLPRQQDVAQMEALTDNVDNVNNFEVYADIVQGAGSSLTNVYYNAWKNAYRYISDANYILARVANSSLTNVEKGYIIGQAMYFRAVMHFELAFFFGDVPYVESNMTISEAKSIKPTPRAEIFQKAIADIKQVEPLLGTSRKPLYEKGRITKWGAKAMRARFHLYIGEWQKALEAAKEVEASGEFELYAPDGVDADKKYQQLFQYAGEENKEFIIRRIFKDDVDHHQVYKELAPAINTGRVTVAPLMSLINNYVGTDGLAITDPASSYDPTNPFSNRDPRLKASILRSGEKFDGKVFEPYKEGSPDKMGGTRDVTTTGFTVKKFLNAEDSKKEYKSDCDFGVFRYAEIYLIIAEASLELKKYDDAATYVNKVRKRVEITPLTVPNVLGEDALRKVVRAERRSELAFEGQRNWDIRRWGIAHVVMNGYPQAMKENYKVENLSNIRKFDKNRDYFYAIPKVEIDLNPNIKQNPGY